MTSPGPAVGGEWEGACGVTAAAECDSPLRGLAWRFGTFPLAGRADAAVMTLKAWLHGFISVIGKCRREQKLVQCDTKGVLPGVSLTFLSRRRWVRASPRLGQVHRAVPVSRFVLQRQGLWKAPLNSKVKSGWFWPSVYHFSTWSYLIEGTYHCAVTFFSLWSSFLTIRRNTAMKAFLISACSVKNNCLLGF